MEKPSLVDKLIGKPASMVKKVLGMQIEFRILSNPERVEVWKKNTSSDVSIAPEAIAIPTLARAIVSVDGVTIDQFSEIQDLKKQNPSTPIVDLFEQHLSDKSSYPFPVINELYLAYFGVVNEYQMYLDELKKNS